MRKITAFFLILLSFSLQAQKINKHESVIRFQNKMNKEFRSPDHSPLSAKDRKAFKALDFFPVDTTFFVPAEFVRTPFESPFQMQTSTDRKPVYVKYGELYFNLKGKEYVLNVYQSQDLKKQPEYKDYLFLPFTDATNGSTSYSGGRYIDLRIPKSKSVELDFNKAYNPYCAYSGEYSCPVPPKENHLDLAVTAGVKAFKSSKLHQVQTQENSKNSQYQARSDVNSKAEKISAFQQQ